MHGSGVVGWNGLKRKYDLCVGGWVDAFNTYDITNANFEWRVETGEQMEQV